MIHKNSFHPRKTRKSRKESIGYSSFFGYPSDASVNPGLQLSLFVFFRVFRVFRGHLGF